MNFIDKNHSNRLKFEQSPYLLQHASNPVNWYPWKGEAFEKAKENNLPIFLSIGYSTCHWCHVMENESFEDEEVAELLNENFVSIKVDREERPDIDHIYMSVCQLLTGSGGWPLTIIMTPEQKPFFAGTYFPKNQRGNRVGLMELLPKISNTWKEQRNEIYLSATEITSHLYKDHHGDNKKTLNNSILKDALNLFKNRFDKVNGGFGTRPKFPSPHNLLFLLRYYSRTKNDEALNMTVKTLLEMRKGGIYDQIGFGFHRYSTDQGWFLPHFEKMLYDQALMSIAYTEAYQVTKNKIFKQTTEEILSYVIRDMTSSNGGFYSAEDADSDGEEGKFYVWSKDEIMEILTEDDANLISEIFNISKNGNYFEEAAGKSTGKNILCLDIDPNEITEKFNFSEEDFKLKFNSIRHDLFNEREKRIHPLKDDKILTDWNGLMIAAFSLAGKVFNNEKYSTAAKRSADFILTNMLNENNLLHRYRNGEAAISANLDDYSFLICGLLELYEACFETKYLKYAKELADTAICKFWDKEHNSGFYFTSSEETKLISRPKEFYDGAVPSGNSVMLMNLIKLNKLTANNEYLDYVDYLISAYKPLVEETTGGYSHFLSGLEYYLSESIEVLICGEPKAEDTKTFIEAINSIYYPNKITLLITSENKNAISKIAPFTKDYSKLDEKAAVYICKNFECSMPTSNVDEILKLLQR